MLDVLLGVSLDAFISSNEGSNVSQLPRQLRSFCSATADGLRKARKGSSEMNSSDARMNEARPRIGSA